MKKFLFIFFGVFVFSGAFAAGENVPTSKGYVDSKLGEKQDIIPANDGAARVLTNTGTAGEYGTKGIYDATGEYAVQAQNLVDAAAMNAGVQNAIDSEFQCIEWLDPNDHTSDCLLFDVFGQIQTQNPNVFDASQLLGALYWHEKNGVYTGQISNLHHLGNMNACASGVCKDNTQYILSYTIAADENTSASGALRPQLCIRYTDGTGLCPSSNVLPRNPGDVAHIILISEAGKTVGYVFGTFIRSALVHISDIELREMRIYIPAGN